MGPVEALRTAFGTLTPDENRPTFQGRVVWNFIVKRFTGQSTRRPWDRTVNSLLYEEALLRWDQMAFDGYQITRYQEWTPSEGEEVAPQWVSWRYDPRWYENSPPHNSYDRSKQWVYTFIRAFFEGSVGKMWGWGVAPGVHSYPRQFAVQGAVKAGWHIEPSRLGGFTLTHGNNTWELSLEETYEVVLEAAAEPLVLGLINGLELHSRHAGEDDRAADEGVVGIFQRLGRGIPERQAIKLRLRPVDLNEDALVLLDHYMSKGDAYPHTKWFLDWLLIFTCPGGMIWVDGPERLTEGENAGHYMDIPVELPLPGMGIKDYSNESLLTDEEMWTRIADRRLG